MIVVRTPKIDPAMLPFPDDVLVSGGSSQVNLGPPAAAHGWFNPGRLPSHTKQCHA